MNEKLIRYLAGIIDGEGTITLTKDGNAGYRMPVISVSSTTFEIIEFLKDNLGGVITNKKVYEEHHKKSWV